MNPRLLVVHQSDPWCLARFHAETTLPKRDSEASLIGTICHAVAEELTIDSVLGTPDVPATTRSVLRAWIGRPGVTRRVVGSVVEIMAAASGPKSRIRFELEPGWKVVPEWAWYLDYKFQPLSPKQASTDEIAYEGRMDRLEVNDARGLVRITDWKTILARPAATEVSTSWQARVYALAALAHFPGAREVIFRFALLRHGYFIETRFARGDTWEHATRESLTASRRARISAEASGKWPETLGEDCNYCPVKYKCAETDRLFAEGGGSPGLLSDADVARRQVALKHLANDFDREARARVAKSDAPLPLADGSGVVLGKKPGTAWEATIEYDVAMTTLRGYGMTPAQEAEWFRFITRPNFAGALKKALYALCGSAAKGMIESGEWIQPFRRETFATWTPDAAPPTNDDVSFADVEEAFNRALDGV